MALWRQEDARVVLGSLRNLATLTLLLLFVPILTVIDAQLSDGALSEYSVTEIAQELLLLSAAVIFAVAARRRSEIRGILLLASGFFATMLVRELDHFWDMLFHGFWVYPALCVAALAIYKVSQEPRSLLSSWARYSQTRSYLLVSIGLLVILGLSRTFGSQLMWRPVLGDGDVYLTKTIIQEGLELFGYLLVFAGSIELLRESPPSQQQTRATRRNQIDISSCSALAKTSN